jgi:hypothetical protein
LPAKTVDGFGFFRILQNPKKAERGFASFGSSARSVSPSIGLKGGEIFQQSKVPYYSYS